MLLQNYTQKLRRNAFLSPKLELRFIRVDKNGDLNLQFPERSVPTGVHSAWRLSSHPEQHCTTSITRTQKSKKRIQSTKKHQTFTPTKPRTS